MQVSVIICTHNPRPNYVHRVLEALKTQTLRREQWELLLIDNASKEPLAGQWDLSWHPHGRIIREEELGLTPARLKGIKESVGELLIFVDDDNILDSDYLEKAAELAYRYINIGAFGCSIRPEFESPAPAWIIPYMPSMAVCEIETDHWSNSPTWSLTSPYGAGLCVRRAVANDYYAKATTHPLRRMLGRAGSGLNSGEDCDLAWCAIDLGMGTGRFHCLKLTHLVPAKRLTEEYVIGLYEGFAFSGEILATLRSKGAVKPQESWKHVLRFWISYLRAAPMRKKIMLRARKASKAARDCIRRKESALKCQT